MFYQLTTQLIRVNFVVVGIEVASCVAFSIIPPLLLKSGFTETQMTAMFGIGPFLALFTIPLIGQWSDSYVSSYGRRKPFIFAFSLLLILSLSLILAAQSMIVNLTYQDVGTYSLALAVIILDYSCQVGINPCESLNADVISTYDLPSTENAFRIYSSMSSFGCCVGYFLSSIDWKGTLPTFVSGEQTVIEIVFVIVLVCASLTMMTLKEPHFKTMSNLSDEEDINEDVKYRGLFIRNPFTYMKKIVGLVVYPFFILKDSGTQVCGSILHAPPVLKKLFIVDLFSWMAVMAHSMFCTDFVAQVVYHGRPFETASTMQNIVEQENFDAGVRMGSFGLLLHSITACLFAIFGMECTIRRIGLRMTYSLGVFSFGMAMFLTAIFPNVIMLNVCAAVSGIGYAVINSVPCSLITAYHSNPSHYFTSLDNDKIEEDRGFGGDMAILDSSYLLSQIILSMFLGIIVDVTGMPHFYMLVAAFCAFTATVLSFKITIPK